MTPITNKLDEINRLARTDSEKIIAVSEKNYAAQIENAVGEFTKDERHRFIMLAGPSSSGKTTTSKKIIAKFRGQSIKAYYISLDDFYGPSELAPLTDDGSPDYESIHALDLPLIHKTLEDILDSGEGAIPMFDFALGRRKEETFLLKLNPGDAVIIEGLHALNPLITGTLPADSLLKLYVSMSTRIYDEDGEVVLGKRDLRFIRRTVRDHKYRDSSVPETFRMWRDVAAGEDKYLFPFEDLAHVKLNSFHPYEPCVMKGEALPLLRGVAPDSEFFQKARSLAANLERFADLPSSAMPPDSLLREFAGPKDALKL
ncbi:MAG: hypothetical protein FWF05_04910 [Oscillospiraceae bacterium]|nr:hypothetical protein [Oscillospiraceae bacterium]